MGFLFRSKEEKKKDAEQKERARQQQNIHTQVDDDLTPTPFLGSQHNQKKATAQNLQINRSQEGLRDEAKEAAKDLLKEVNISLVDEDIEAKVQKLRENSENTDNVSFSLGFYYNENGGNIRTAMHEADVRMYEDKKQFYLRHPEKRKKL